MSTQPNILFIITDQHRAADVGFMGNEVVRTPNLDSLAARGMVFDRAWVANPICMPNRSTIMTGRMPSVHGVIFNDRSLELGAATHVRQFRNAGYRTGLLGKSHLQHGMSRNAVAEIDLTPTVDYGNPEGWDQLEHDDLYMDGEPEWPDDFYGFGHVEIAIDHGARVTGHHLRWALERGGRYEDLVVPYTAESPAKRRSERWWQVYEPPYAEELHSTNFVTERTIEFIDEAVAADEPFYAWASFPDPHHPMTPPGRWFDRHDPADMELPVSINDPLEHAPEYLRRTQQRPLDQQRMWVSGSGATDHELVKECIAATYGAIEFIDDGVGRILAAIEAHGELDNTIIVFTADHGDMMGEHGLMLKGFMPFKGTHQVPMVIVDPRRTPGRTSSLGGSIDLAPTLMDMCDIRTHDGIQGHSLVPILDDPAAKVRDQVLIEQDLRAVATRGWFPHRIRTLVSDDGSEYTRWNTGESMLYDLSTDPDELDELSHADPVRKAEQDDRLVGALMEATDDARGAPVGSHG